jgi:hypothetical protein
METLAGFADERKWGVHASLVGDAYVNFGTAGVGIVMGLFGILLKLLYVKFREGILQGAFYVLAVVYAAQIFLQSIEAWPYMLTVLVFASCIILLARGCVDRP